MLAVPIRPDLPMQAGHTGWIKADFKAGATKNSFLGPVIASAVLYGAMAHAKNVEFLDSFTKKLASFAAPDGLQK